MKKLMLMAAIVGLSLGIHAQDKTKEKTKDGVTTTKTKDGGKKKVMVEGTTTAPAGKTLSTPAGDAPVSKPKKRGYCYMKMDNYTGYYVDIWVEDTYMGRLSPYATSVQFDVWVPGNWTHWYAKTAGGTYYWSNDSYCNDSRTFTLNLKQ
jgi:hypothetical protein